MDKIEELRGLLALMESAKSSHEHELHARRAVALLPALLSRLESAEKVVECTKEAMGLEASRWLFHNPGLYQRTQEALAALATRGPITPENQE